MIFFFQGNAGIGLSLLIIVLTLLVALAPALSAIGICERTHVESGGVYFLLAHVLGQRSGGTVAILYSFGMVRESLKSLKSQLLKWMSWHHLIIIINGHYCYHY